MYIALNVVMTGWFLSANAQVVPTCRLDSTAAPLGFLDQAME